MEKTNTMSKDIIQHQMDVEKYKEEMERKTQQRIDNIIREMGL